jgi:hypothetical protein
MRELNINSYDFQCESKFIISNFYIYIYIYIDPIGVYMQALEKQTSMQILYYYNLHASHLNYI